MWHDSAVLRQPVTTGVVFDQYASKSIPAAVLSNDDKKLHDIKLHDITGNMFKSREEFSAYIYPILKEAISGMESLKTTYKEDETFIAQLELELDRLTRIAISLNQNENENEENEEN